VSSAKRDRSFVLVFPGLALLTLWAVIMPVIVIEGSGVRACFGRSHQLVPGRGWHVLNVVANTVLHPVFSGLPPAEGGGLSDVITGTLISPFLAVEVTLVYYRLVGPPREQGFGVTIRE